MPSIGPMELVIALFFIALPVVLIVLGVLNFPKIMYVLGKAWARGVRDGNKPNQGP